MITPTGTPGDRTHAKNPLPTCCSESRTCRRAVAPYYIKGDLENYLFSHPHIHLSDRVDLCFDILVGLKELHSGFIIHRDLKLNNIFVDGQDRGMVGILEDPESRSRPPLCWERSGIRLQRTTLTRSTTTRWTSGGWVIAYQLLNPFRDNKIMTPFSGSFQSVFCVGNQVNS